jgi:hypothetical protein
MTLDVETDSIAVIEVWFVGDNMAADFASERDGSSK